MRKDCNSLKNRDDRFDTLKGFLIILVVFGHLLDQKVFFADRDMPIVDAIYACIYSFHMPAMVLISGYFSKQGETGPGYYRKLTRSYLIPFAVFDLLQWLVTSRKLNVLLTPRFSMWFLLSLFFWKLLLPAVRSFRFPLLLSLGFALFAGLTKASTFLSVSRTITFLPFFLAGYYLRSEQIEKLRRIPKILPALVLLLSLALAFFLSMQGVTPKIYHMKESFQKLSLTAGKGLLLRALVLIAGFASSFSLIALVPGRKTPLTALGTRTILVYLFHGLIIKILLLLEPDIQLGRQSLALLGAAVFTAAICLLFGSRFAARGFHAVMDRIGRLLLKDSE